MSDVALMQIVQSQEQLLYESFGFLFTELPVSLRLQMSVQALTIGVLHNKVDILCSVNAFMQLHDVGVIELGQDLDLPYSLLLPLQIQKFVPIILLDRNSFSRFPVYGLLDFGVCTSANELAKRVVIYLRAVWRRELVILKYGDAFTRLVLVVDAIFRLFEDVYLVSLHYFVVVECYFVGLVWRLV